MRRPAQLPIAWVEARASRDGRAPRPRGEDDTLVSVCAQDSSVDWNKPFSAGGQDARGVLRVDYGAGGPSAALLPVGHNGGADALLVVRGAARLDAGDHAAHVARAHVDLQPGRRATRAPSCPGSPAVRSSSSFSSFLVHIHTLWGFTVHTTINHYIIIT